MQVVRKEREVSLGKLDWTAVMGSKGQRVTEERTGGEERRERPEARERRERKEIEEDKVRTVFLLEIWPF